MSFNELWQLNYLKRLTNTGGKGKFTIELLVNNRFQLDFKQFTTLVSLFSLHRRTINKQEDRSTICTTNFQTNQSQLSNFADFRHEVVNE